jgi:hypothetical protein
MSAYLTWPQPEPDFASGAVTAAALDQPAHCLADKIALKLV